MAMRAFVLGQKAVVKESGGKFFLSKAVSWTDKPALRPKKVVARNEAFITAVEACRAEPKGKGGTVWGKSTYNKCIGDHLRKAKTPV